MISGYFVHNPQNETNAVWWNSDFGHQIDFTKPEAVTWWSDRVQSIQDTTGMDSFKFDAGEVDYVNQVHEFLQLLNDFNLIWMPLAWSLWWCWIMS